VVFKIKQIKWFKKTKHDFLFIILILSSIIFRHDGFPIFSL